MKRQAMLLVVVVVAALVLCSGVALAVTERCEDRESDCYGTKGDDTLRGTTYGDTIYGRGGNDTLMGFSGRDDLHGQGGRDTLLGGKNPDYLHGGRGNDTLDGGQGEDFYYFDTRGWGKDRIIDTLEPKSVRGDNIVQFEWRSGGVIVNLASDSGPTPEIRNKSDNSTVNWDSDVINAVYGSIDDDTISGNSATNFIYGGPTDGISRPYSGDDTISGGDGDDYIYVSDKSGGDTVECGEGNDAVYRDRPDPATGDPGDTIAPDCENQLDHNQGFSPLQ